MFATYLWVNVLLKFYVRAKINTNEKALKLLLGCVHNVLTLTPSAFLLRLLAIDEA